MRIKQVGRVINNESYHHLMMIKCRILESQTGRDQSHLSKHFILTRNFRTLSSIMTVKHP